MAMDPASLGVGVASGVVGNIVTNIIKLYAPYLDHTIVGRAFKALGISDYTREDHLRDVLNDSLKLYFKLHPAYNISSVADFFSDSETQQLIANFIFDHRPIDQRALDDALTRHLRNDPIIYMYMQQRGTSPKQVVPDFLACYRQVLNERTDVADRAILLGINNATDIVIAKIVDSEEELKAFITDLIQQQMQLLKDTTPHLAPEQIFGGYRVQRYLTAGTFGSLYLAQTQDKGTSVVLKVISVPEGLRLHYEVFSLGDRLVNLRHPSILSTLEVYLNDMIPYIVTEYAEGGSLQDRIHRYAPQGLPYQEAINIITQVGQALSYLHQQGIIHRGVQPASIVFDKTGRTLLTGFDLAILASAIRHYLLPNKVGAINYMAPEQSSGVLSEKSDQYALGCIAYELVTGRRLNIASPKPSPQQQIRSSLAPRMINSKVPIQVERAILRSVDVIPNRRYNTVEAFVAALGT